MINTSTERFNKLTLYVVSDVHLNNHKYDKNDFAENPERKIFREFLSRVIDEFESGEQILLVLNGDIFDITSSWFNSLMPWEENANIEELVCKVVLEIINNNLDVFHELREILKRGSSKIVYVIGNHDGLLEIYPNAQKLIKNKLLEGLSSELTESNPIKFVNCYENKELGLYVEHGHRLDPHNLYDSTQKPPLGDVINILIVNRFLEKTVNKLKEYGYSEDVINKIKNRLHDIEYIRPLVLIPLWIETIAKENESEPESKGKKESLQTILRSIIAEILLDKNMSRYIVNKLHIPMFILHSAAKLLIRLPQVMPLVSYICTRLVRRTHSNRFQIKVATKLSEEKGYKLICFGHTHIPFFKALSPTSYYFNTASWTPVINLFKFDEYEMPTEEILTLDEHFKKVERCGYLKVEKDLKDPKAKAKFSLQTIQIGEN